MPREELGFKFPTEKRIPFAAAAIGDAFQGDFGGAADAVPDDDDAACSNCCIGRVALGDTPVAISFPAEVEEVPWSGEWTVLNPSRFCNGFGDGRDACCDFDALELVLDST